MGIYPKKGLEVNGKWVPCEVVRRPLQNRRTTLTTTHDAEIPSMHERVLHIEHKGMLPPGDTILEPAVEDSRSFLVARSLIDPRNQTVPVRIVNISDQPLKIKKGYLLGDLQPVENVVELAPGVEPAYGR